MMSRNPMRHLLATLAYRTRQIVEDVSEDYPDFDAGFGVRPPVEILCHMSGVLNYAAHCFQPVDPLRLKPLPWEQEKERFGSILKRLDQHLESGDEPQKGSLEILLQGPFCDALTHVGQLATLRRMAGVPVPGENFMKAPVEIGKLDVT
ncbi:MAG: hypothetical protein GY856_47835 [bacterium]|nr:hypothetical protein [bacterium]